MAELDRLDIVLVASSEDAAAKVNKAADAVANLGKRADGTKLTVMRLKKELSEIAGAGDVEIDVDDKSVSKAAKTMSTFRREMKKINATTVTVNIEASAKDILGASDLEFAKIQRDALSAQYDQMRAEGTFSTTEIMQVAKALRAAERDVVKFTKSEELAVRANKSFRESLKRIFSTGDSSLGKEVEKNLSELTDVRQTEIAAGLELPGETDLDMVKEAFNQTLDKTLENAVRETATISENTEKAFSVGKVQRFGKSITNYALKPLRKLAEWNQKQAAISTPKTIPKSTAASPLSDLEQAQQYVKGWDKATLLEKKIEGAMAKLADSLSDPNMTADKIARQVEGIQKLQNELDNLGKATDKLSVKWPKFIKSIGRITFYRLVRGAIKAITDAMTVGMQNAYAFSKGVGDRIAPAMDRITSASLKMKNQFGAAFGSLLTAIAPLLIQITNLATKAANAITQLFAALTGGTYLKAKDVSAEWAENTAAGAAAAEEWKNQLLGFDEINRLEAPSTGGGGGGGASALDPSEMFEVAEINEKLKSVVDYIKEHMTEILIIATAIGAAILAWKTANTISNLVGISGWLKAIFGILGSIVGVAIFTVSAFDAWENGVDWANLAGMITGVAIVVGALAIAFGTTTAAIALLIGGIAMLVIGAKDWITTGELSTETFVLLEAGILAAGIALSAFVGPWAIVVAAIGAAALAIYKYWDDIKAVLNTMIAGVESFVNKVIGAINNLLGGVNSVAHAFGYTGNIQIGYVSIPRFADGGYPIAGTLMVAGEAGAEMVGKVNGRTGVASNQEITGIADAVYTVGSQILAAMRDTDRTTKVYIDKRQIAEAVSQSQRQTARATGV